MAIERGDIMEVDSDSEDGDEAENVTPEYTFTQVFTLCQQLEDACLQFGELEVSFDLSKRLQAFRACNDVDDNDNDGNDNDDGDDDDDSDDETTRQTGRGVDNNKGQTTTRGGQQRGADNDEGQTTTRGRQ
ncbi:hypothetical protein BD769DRAFT_1388266 [Suillus cothurnatus]|nr:hypothetical protein BD769DRAFT_1388266 [Suillus cothurnatus]